MRYPEFLKAGQKIGYVAPSFGCVIEPYHSLFENALKVLQEKGYQNILGPNVYENSGVGKSSSPQSCAAEVNRFFMEEDCSVILSCGGGETMCEDLPYFDFPGIARARAKWYMGYSDNTHLTFTLPTLCDTAAIYGSCAPAFGQIPWDDSIRDSYNLLTGKNLTLRNYPFFVSPEAPEAEDPLAPTPYTEADCRRQFIGKREETGEIRVSGRLLGGCLDCLLMLLGTPYGKTDAFNQKYKEDGVLWFLEACDLNPMSIRRGLWQLRQAGWFACAKGFLIGRPLHFAEDYMGVDRINAVLDTLGDMDLPILLDLDIGHLPPRMPLISGAFAEVLSTREQFRLTHILR